MQKKIMEKAGKALFSTGVWSSLKLLGDKLRNMLGNVSLWKYKNQALEWNLNKLNLHVLDF